MGCLRAVGRLVAGKLYLPMVGDVEAGEQARQHA
jgi:hypothetical protein